MGAAATVGYRRHRSRHLALGRQWLGTGWVPWRGGGGVPPQEGLLGEQIWPQPSWGHHLHKEDQQGAQGGRTMEKAVEWVPVLRRHFGNRSGIYCSGDPTCIPGDSFLGTLWVTCPVVRSLVLCCASLAVLEIECIPKLVIIASDCIPGFRSVCPMCIPTFKCVYPMCIPTFSSFIVLRAQFPSPSFPCGSSPDTMKQLSLKPHLTAPSAKDDDSSSSSGSPAPFFMVCVYHMCIPGF